MRNLAAITVALVLAMSVAAQGVREPGKETWRLQVSGTLKAQTQIGSITQTVNGALKLEIDARGRVTGRGKLRVIQQIRGRNGVRIDLHGDGAVEATGHRDGDFLIFSFKGEIPLKGKGTAFPTKAKYDTSSLAVRQRILRKEGATSRHHVDGAMPQASIDNTFTLSNGRNVRRAKRKDKAKQEGPSKAPSWILEYEIDVTDVHQSKGVRAVIKGKLKGSATFTLPRRDGPVRAKGLLAGSVVTATKLAGIPEQRSTTKTRGELRIEGEIAKGVLTFTPQFVQQTARTASPQGVNVRSNIWPGQSLAGPGKVSIPVKSRSEIKIPVNSTVAGVKRSGHVVWRLRGTTQVWRLEAVGRMLMRIEIKPSPWAIRQYSAGLWVEVRTVVDVEIEQEKVLRASGTSRFGSFTSFSDPEGVWKVQSIRKLVNSRMAPHLYKMKHVISYFLKNGRLWVFTDGGSFAVAWRVKLNEAAAAKAIPNWDRRKQHFTKMFENEASTRLTDSWEFELVDGHFATVIDEPGHKGTIRVKRVR